MQQGYAGPDGELGLGEAVRKPAEGFYAEGGGDPAVVYGEADLFPGFAAGDLVCGWRLAVRSCVESACAAWRVEGTYRGFLPDCLLFLPEMPHGLFVSVSLLSRVHRRGA